MRLTTMVPRSRSGSCTMSATYPGTTIPPAARPRVSEKIRLITRPRPIACSTTSIRPVPEVEHDFLSEPYDIPDSDDHGATLHEVQHALEDALGAKTPEVTQPAPVEAVRDR